MTIVDRIVLLVRTLQPTIAMSAGAMLTVGVILWLGGARFAGTGWLLSGVVNYYLAHYIVTDMRRGIALRTKFPRLP